MNIKNKMTQTKYFQKLKYENLSKFPNWHTNSKGFYDCPICHKAGIIKGADITETIKMILEGIDDEIKKNSKYFHKEKDVAYHPELLPKGVGEIEFCSLCMEDDYCSHELIIKGLQKAKQIIEKNVIEVEE